MNNFDMDSLIERCHARRAATLTQQQTEVLPARHTDCLYHYKVYYAQDAEALLYDFERADISVLPIGKVPFDRAPADWLRKDQHRNRVDERQGGRGWRPRQWYASWGIGIYTGVTSGQGSANWHDVVFTSQAISEAPETTLVCLEALIHAVKDPLVTLTKDGYLRFTCRMPDYLHPNTVEDKLYAYKHQPTQTNPKNRDVYVTIKGDKDYSVWDARHEILIGSVFNPPLINSDVLFALLRFFKILLHNPAWSVPDTRRVHTPKALDVRNITKTLDTNKKTISVPDKMRAVRDGQLSPLAIQRPEPVISKQPLVEPVDISEILNSDADVIGIQTGLRGESESREIERTLTSHFGGEDSVYIRRTLYPSNLFTKHELTLNTIKGYIQYPRGSALSDFASALHNVLKITNSDKTDNIVARLRAVMKTFENTKEALIAQMSQGSVSPTYWHQLKRFFDHYPRDADAPMYFDGHVLEFRLPPAEARHHDGTLQQTSAVVHPHTRKTLFLSPSIETPILQRTFPGKKVEVYDYRTQEALVGNRVYQLRSVVHSPHSLLNYDLDWDALSLSAIGTRYAVGMYHETQNTPEKQHIIVSTQDMDTALSEILSESNALFSFFHARHIDENQTLFEDMFEDADVVWVFGTPYIQPEIVWRCAKMLYGDMEEPLDYTVSMHPYHFKDPRLQGLSEAYSRQVLVAMLAYADDFRETTGKTLLLQTALWLPGITDAPETRLFDWEDFEVAGGLENLQSTIDKRAEYEAQASEIDASWMPYQIMPILGVDYKEAERLLIEKYGRERFVRVAEEVVALLSQHDTPLHLKEIKASLTHRSPRSIEQSLYELVHEGVVVKLRRGLYGLQGI